MEDFDDDFGDLYADVEVQASSAINGGRDFTRFYTGPSEEDDTDGDANNTPARPSSENDNGSGSESEDDLNIVLNDEDCEAKNFPFVDQVDTKNQEDKDGFVAIKEEVKYIRTHGSSIPSDVKANASASVLAIRELNYIARRQLKGPSSGQNDLIGATRNSLMNQNRCGFSLPWYRSVLDVNIDTFEEKPWTYPGIDITDFFNFGFNEDSWREYCNSLEQFRSQAFMQLGNSDHVSQRQVCEAGLQYDERVGEAMVDDIVQSNGRAIQVEDGTGERQPSVDVRRPRDRDSDVVIQIALDDPIEDTFDTGEKLDRSGSPQCETSNNEEFGVSDCSSSKKDKFSVEYLEENDKKADRCSVKTTAFKPMTNDRDDTEKNQSPDVDGNHHDEKGAFSSDGTSHLLEVDNKTRESVVVKAGTADQYMVDRELSLEEEGQLSLTSSCFESDSEASRDSSHVDCGKVTSPRRRTSAKSGMELWDSDTSRHKNQRGNYAKIKTVNFRDYSKCKIPVQGKQKHRTRTVGSPAQRKIAVNDNDASWLDAEDMYDKGHLSAKFGRRKDKMEDVDFTDREDLTYYEKSKQSNCYGIRGFAKDHIHTARKNYRNGSREFHEVRDRNLTENWKERGYLCEDERREGYRCWRVPSTSDMPVAYKETGQFVSRYSSTSNEMDFRSKRKNKLQFRKQDNHCSRFPDYEFDDADFMRERYAKSVSLINRKRDTLDEYYERQVHERQKEVKRFGWKRYKDSSPLELEGLWSREIKDEYWKNTDVHFLSRHSYRESDEDRWIELKGSWPRKIEDEYWGNTDVHHLSHQSYRESDGGRWTDPMSPRKGVSRSRFVERYRRQMPPMEGEENGWFENHNDSHKFEDNFIYPDDEVPFRRKRRFSWKSEVMPWIEEELTVRHREEKLNFKNSSFCCKKDGRHRRNPSSHGSLHDAMHIDDMQAEKYGYKTIGDGSDDTRSMYRRQKMYRAKNEQAFLRCRDSVDLFVGEGKLSRKRPVDRNLICNSRPEGTNPEGFDESPRFKPVQHNLPKVDDQFPLAVRNEDFEIEEGQIVTEEPCMGDSVSAACTHSVKKQMLEDDLASHGGKTGGACDDQRILETLAKMERRRERFKEPIALKREQEKCTKPEIVPPTIVESPETKQQHRPARKRQWRTGQGS